MSRMVAALTAADNAVSQVATLPGAAAGDRLRLLHQLRARLEGHISRLTQETAQQLAAHRKQKDED